MNDRISWLGQAEAPVSVAAWDSYLRGLATNLQSAWDRALSAHHTLHKVRTTLGLPFIVDRVTEAGATPGAWASDLEQQMLELQVMVQTLVGAANDTVAGKRQLGWNDQTNDFEIERLPEDAVRIETRNGRPVLIGNMTNEPVEVTGSLGIAPIVWVGIAAVAAVATYFIVEEACKTVETVAKQKTYQTLSNHQHDLVTSGKATPEQAAKMTETILTGAKELEEAEAIKTEATSPLMKTITTVSFVALGLGVLYVVAQVIATPKTLPARA